MKLENSKYTDILDEVPEKINDSDILSFLHNREINGEYLTTIKKFTAFNDDIISFWLNINIKTFRSYRQPNLELKENLKEHVLLLLSLIKHGIHVFGSKENFDQWLLKENFYLNGKTPASYLTTITGIRFVDDRLTAIQYGDNI